MPDKLGDMRRTHHCRQLDANDIGKEVVLMGWVQRRRDHGGVIFVDLRDREGLTQVVFNPEVDRAMHEKAHAIRNEYVIGIRGEVEARPEGMINPSLKTGEIEVLCRELRIFNAAETPPFLVEDRVDVSENIRLTHRHIDLRRPGLQRNIITRHRTGAAVRNFLNSQGFLDIETPFLTKATPEGARDYLVPSRVNPGMFYALPQSPQLFKQLFMIAGLDRYYQIVRCFRDEDLRADRQPEFTQIDCEMAFVEQEDILNTFEDFTRHLIKAVKGVEVTEFPRMTYDEAMKKYGNDKPDIRFGMEFGELNDLAKNKGFNVFDQQELVVGIAVPGAASFTRKEIDKLIEWVKRPQIGANGLVWAKYNEDETLKSSVDKFYSEEDLKSWAERTGAKAGDLILVMAGDEHKTRTQLSALRMHLGNELGLRKADEFAPLWVVDFPLLEWDEETQRYHAMHHPFTSPKPEDIKLLDTDPGKVRANAYDLVLNGNEIGGGSIRIHDKKTQAMMFDHLGFTPEEAKAQFGFLMDAFQYGAPPHGGIAFGFDRLVAILGGQETIRDYIAFPKNNSGRDVMIDAPANISEDQLKELNLRVTVQQ